MDRQTYDGYLAEFNARDYHGVLAYFAEEFEVGFAGYSLKSRAQVLDFYRFLHTYVKETITIDRFLSDERTPVHPLPPQGRKIRQSAVRRLRARGEVILGARVVPLTRINSEMADCGRAYTGTRHRPWSLHDRALPSKDRCSS